jgi:hypothetical protein
MSNNQEIFENFPDDGGCWLVKWIDEFRLAHARTRSTSVAAILQRLRYTSSEEIAWLHAANCPEILGRQSDGEWPRFCIVRVLVGSLPNLTLGAIFQNKVKIGELPWLLQQLTSHPGELDETEVEVGTEVTPPPGWSARYPYRTLNAFEYAGLTDHNHGTLGPARFTKSRLMVFVRRHGRREDIYVIPRTAIFKAFYAPTTEIAKAFCGGPWATSLESVYCLSDLKSGLKTEDTGAQWNVILQPRIPHHFAWLLAVLLFDPFGRACAESIYARGLQDRQSSAMEPWYASARIPYRAVDEPLRIAVKCLPLRRRSVANQEGEISETRKFLVAEICGSTWPSHYPLVGWEKANSGETSPDSKPVDLPPPYYGHPRRKEI